MKEIKDEINSLAEIKKILEQIQINEDSGMKRKRN